MRGDLLEALAILQVRDEVEGMETERCGRIQGILWKGRTMRFIK